jgi:DNA primase
VSASDIATLVKQSVDIVDVIGQVVALRRSGNRHVGLCPFHKEKTGSFHVDAANQLYYCFGCHSGGDVLKFIMTYQNLPFSDAVRYLADRYNIALPQQDYSYQAAGTAAEESRRERDLLYDALKKANDYFYDQLHHGEAGRNAREYLRMRALPAQVVEAERIGYAPPRWDGLLRHFESSGVDLDVGLKAGLFSKSAKERLFDRFRDRLIFPIADDRGRVVAFGGRALSKETDGPKYLNSPETPVFQKGRMLYQSARARAACREVRQVVLVEGYMDLLAFHAKEFYRVVATLGTALTAHQVRILKRMVDEVVLAYDSDDAGERSLLRALPFFLQEELPVSCIRFPQGMDPDDYLKAQGLSALEELLQCRTDLGRYAVEKMLGNWDGSTSGKIRVLAEFQPIYDAVLQPLLKAEYLRIVADRLSLSEKVAEEQLLHGRTDAGRSPGATRAAPISRVPQTQPREESILRLMIRYPDLIEEVRSSEAVNYFQESRLKAVALVLVEAYRQGDGMLEPSTVYDMLPEPELKELYTRFQMEPADLHEPLLQMRDWLQALRECKTRQNSLESLNESLRRAQEAGDSARVRALLAQIHSLCSTQNRAKCSQDNLEGVKHQ